VNPTASQALSSDRARTLLRRLRDLNLVAGPVAVTREAWYMLAGCLSVDGPVENGVRYRVEAFDRIERVLEIAWSGAALRLSLSVAGTRESRALTLPVRCDGQGRACVPEIGARVHPDSIDTRELEHFLRRVVRAVARG
jgi:hypothetical protein